jgi:hypothetical protein
MEGHINCQCWEVCSHRLLIILVFDTSSGQLEKHIEFDCSGNWLCGTI